MDTPLAERQRAKCRPSIDDLFPVPFRGRGGSRAVTGALRADGYLADASLGRDETYWLMNTVPEKPMAEIEPALR